MSPLSPKQLEVLNFIRRFIADRNLPPTRGEIAAGLGLKNRQGIEQHLRALQLKGAIDLLPGISRGIRLRSGSPHASLQNAGIPTSSTSRGEAAQHDEERERKTPGLPLLGRIAAGSPILATDNIEEWIDIDPALFRPRADFLLRVRGDSMQDAGIQDQDLLAVHRAHEARDGQIVVARIDDEATVKYYRRDGHRVRLEPANSAYRAIEIDLRTQPLTIEGLAVGLVRSGMKKL